MTEEGIGEAWLARLDAEAERFALPHPDSMIASERRRPVAPLPRAGEGTGVSEDTTRSGPYASLWDFWRRTRLPREPIEHLVRLGAFAWTGLHERELLWQIGLFYQPLHGQLPLALPYDAELVPLREMRDGERVREDVVLTEGAITTRGHIMDLASLHEGVTPSYLVERLEEGAKVTVAGFVAVRQAPETAKGFVFHTLEDRHGLVNIITAPNLVRRYKELITEAGALIVYGHIERQERAVNVITERLEPLPLAGAVPAARTHSFG